MATMMSIDEVARETGLSISTVKRACYRGDLPSTKKGRRRLVRTVDFERWITPDETHSGDGNPPKNH